MKLGDHSGIAISISGGKDSQTIIGVIMQMVKEQGYGGPVVAIHADTGAEWPQSLGHCELLCRHYGIPFEVAVPFRALPDHIERRCKMMAEQTPVGKPGWPSPAQRYCTSDCKRGPIQKAVRLLSKQSLGPRILAVTGERREESRHRAVLPEIDIDKALSCAGREVIQYRPILDFTLEQVWTHIKGTGLPRHVAYDLGNDRLSCAICMLATNADIRRGAKACPCLAQRYLGIEEKYGFTFKHKKSLKEILKGQHE
jgi:3'-phosphoadenosine 5'-phosphosulfate sulfotransferase (PAPS reductase)/FAD synthetase